MKDNTSKNIYASLIATGFAELATLPICTIKTNYQNSGSKSIIGTSRQIYRMNGICGFYSASFPAIAGQMFSTCSKYTLYRWFQSNPDYPIKNRFLNGMTAGTLSSLVTHPLDVVKVHLQMNASILNTVRENGIVCFYRGYSKTFSKIVVASSLFFPLYETIKSHINNSLVASATSSVVATAFMHPIDYLKTRHMMGLSLYNGINPLNYYKGITLNLMRIVPHFMITMYLIEKFTG